MDTLPQTGLLRFSDLRMFGTRSNTSNTVAMGDYLPRGQFATEIDYSSNEEISQRGMNLLRGKGRMAMQNVAVDSVTHDTSTVRWTGSKYSFARVTWPGGFSNIPYGTFSYRIPNLTPNQQANIVVEPVTGSGKVVASAAPPPLTIETLPSTDSLVLTVSNVTSSSATISWSGGIYSNMKVSWSGYSTGSSNFLANAIKTFVITGLTASQGYTFTLTPYNSTGIPGPPVNSNVTNTLPPTPTVKTAFGSTGTMTNNTLSYTLSSYFNYATSYAVTTSPYSNATISAGILRVTGNYRYTSYSVIVTASNVSGSVTNTLSVVEGIPVPSLRAAFGSTGTMTNNTVSYTLSSYFNNATSYSFSSNPYGNASISGGTLNVSANYRNTSYNIIVTASNASGSVTNTLGVSEGAAPAPPPPPVAPVGTGLTASRSGGGAQINWNASVYNTYAYVNIEVNHYGQQWLVGRFTSGTTSAYTSFYHHAGSTVHVFFKPFYGNGTAGTDDYVGYYASY